MAGSRSGAVDSRARPVRDRLTLTIRLSTLTLCDLSRRRGAIETVNGLPDKGGPIMKEAWHDVSQTRPFVLPHTCLAVCAIGIALLQSVRAPHGEDGCDRQG